MNFRDLKYLVTLADHRHFSKAADECFVSQPALSMQIKKLEEMLGVQLLERHHKPVLLTEVGAIIAGRARQILTQVEEIREISKLANNPYATELKVGIIPTLAPYLLPYIIPELSEKFPEVSFYLVEAQSAELIEKLKQGELDAAILGFPISESSFTTTPLFREEFLLAVSNMHELKNKKSLKQTDLENRTLLLLEEGHCFREQALAFCTKTHAHEVQNFQATSIETLRHMVMAGVGITLIPKLACKKEDNLVYIPFNNLKPTRTIGIIWRASSAKQLLLNAFILKIKKILKKQKILEIIE